MRNEAEIHKAGFDVGIVEPVNLCHAAELRGAIIAIQYILEMSRYPERDTEWKRLLSGWEHKLTGDKT